MDFRFLLRVDDWASEGESSTTSNSWLQKVYFLNCSLEPGEYLIEWYSEIKNTDRTSRVKARCAKSGGAVVFGYVDIMPDTQDYDGWGSFSGKAKITITTTTAYAAKLEFCSEINGKEVKMRRGRMFLWRMK